MQVRKYQVGGSVRDELLGLAHHDIDYVVEAPSFTAMKEWLENNRYDIFVETPQYGCIKARTPDKKYVADFVLARKDGYYSDNRRPDSIEPADLLSDLARRDFTINAIAKDENTGDYIDPYGGIQDLTDYKIRCVGCTTDRLCEDPLRGLRALRFSITKHMQIDQEILDCMQTKEFITKFKTLSVERIQCELNKMLKYNSYKSGKLLFSVLHKSLLKHIFSCSTKLWLQVSMKQKK